MNRKPRLSMTLGAAALAVSGFIAIELHLVAPGAASTTSAPSSNPVALHDAQDKSTLSVQLQAGRRDTGVFDFHAVGVGDYLGQASIAQPGVAGNSAAVWTISGVSSATFVASGAQSSRPVSVVISGSVATTNYAAAVSLVDQSSHAVYTLITDRGDPTTATAFVAKIGQAMAARDYATLYASIAPEALSGTTEQQFAQNLGAQNTPTIVSVAPNGAGRATYSAGYTYWIQPSSVTYMQPSGIQTAITINMYLVREHGNWYLVTSDTPPSP
jgi:hypothetical protein